MQALINDSQFNRDLFGEPRRWPGKPDALLIVYV